MPFRFYINRNLQNWSQIVIHQETFFMTCEDVNDKKKYHMTSYIIIL